MDSIFERNSQFLNRFEDAQRDRDFIFVCSVTEPYHYSFLSLRFGELLLIIYSDF